ncbi:MAG TPA: ABC transporter permease [Gemmataceae bacterium]|nr:ABC transporter permease [Gemmataceae bacterium]
MPPRGFFVLVVLSFQRHWRVRQMGWVAVGLLFLSVVSVVTITATPAGWGFPEQRSRRSSLTTRERAIQLEQLHLLPLPAPAQGIEAAILAANAPFVHAKQVNQPQPDSLPPGVARIDDPALAAQNREAVRTLHRNWEVVNFSRWIVFGMYLGFVLPLFTLSYASAAFGTERESRSLIWLMTRPLPRSAIYAAKFLGTLPWCLLFSCGGFLALCLAGGPTGRAAIGMYWPAVIGGTIAFAALFHLIGAIFRRPVVVGLVYVFFYEALVAALPGSLKLLSLSYYARSLMYNGATAAGYPSEMLGFSDGVSSVTAWSVLAVVAVAISGVGMWLFARNEYRDDI